MLGAGELNSLGPQFEQELKVLPRCFRAGQEGNMLAKLERLEAEHADYTVRCLSHVKYLPPALLQL